MLGGSELLIIVAIVLVLFGGSKLPGLSRGLGKSIKNFKLALRGDDDIEVRRVTGDPKVNEKQDDTVNGKEKR